MRQWWVFLITGILPLVSTIAHGACLPTLGTDDCFRGEDPEVQAIEHRYLDAPAASAPAKKVRHHKKVVHKDSSGGSEKSEHGDQVQVTRVEAVEEENRTIVRVGWDFPCASAPSWE
jgi:hypothetical protein